MNPQRAGLSTFWTTIADMSTAAFVTAQALYTEGVNRLADRTIWLRDAITKVRSDLANATLGKPAIIVGAVDLSGLNYDPIAGDLVGKVFQLQSDTSGVVTVALARA